MKRPAIEANSRETDRDELRALVEDADGEHPNKVLIVVTSTGEEVCLTVTEAATLVSTLLADGDVHNAWLHGAQR